MFSQDRSAIVQGNVARVGFSGFRQGNIAGNAADCSNCSSKDGYLQAIKFLSNVLEKNDKYM